MLHDVGNNRDCDVDHRNNTTEVYDLRPADYTYTTTTTTTCICSDSDK